MTELFGDIPSDSDSGSGSRGPTQDIAGPSTQDIAGPSRPASSGKRKMSVDGDGLSKKSKTTNTSGSYDPHFSVPQCTIILNHMCSAGGISTASYCNALERFSFDGGMREAFMTMLPDLRAEFIRRLM